jgi:hypothetical protein
MSVPKQMAKRRRLELRRRRKQVARQRHQAQHPALPGEVGIAHSVGGIRMSDVLEDFVEPFIHYLPDEPDLNAYRGLLSLGMAAWNAALTPDLLKRQRLIDDVIRSGLCSATQDQAIFRQLVDELIVRKERHFAGYNRPILDFVLEDRGDSWHLTVASVVAMPAQGNAA